MKQTIAGDKLTMRGSKKSSTLLCAKKNPKKKKRNKFGGTYNDDGYPLYATTAIDGRCDFVKKKNLFTNFSLVSMLMIIL